MAQAPHSKEWRPARFTRGGVGQIDGLNPYLVLVSNQPLEEKSIFLAFCISAIFVVCADGGANRVKDLGLSEQEERDCHLDFICGDLDSARPEVLDYYAKKGVKIARNPDQYSTDITKCYNCINENPHLFNRISGNQQVDIALLGGLGGRLDQAFSQINHLYTTDAAQYPWMRDIYLITTEGIMLLLAKECNNMIHTPVKAGIFTENVGIIPIGKSSIITTHGLEWDVTDWSTEFGGHISTSNHIRAEVVKVWCSERVLFTMEFDKNWGQRPAEGQ